MSFANATSPLNIIALFCTFFGGALFFIALGAIIGTAVKHKCILAAVNKKISNLLFKNNFFFFNFKLIVYICIILVLSFGGLFFTLAFVNNEVTRLLNSVTVTALNGYGTDSSVTQALNYVQYYVSVFFFFFISSVTLKDLFLLITIISLVQLLWYSDKY